MAERSALSPHTSATDGFSTLEELARMALRRAGDFGESAVKGEVAHLMVDLSHNIIEDVRTHMYWDGTALDYYTSITETRPVPDTIIMHGLVAFYTLQQGSKKAEVALKMYYRALNQALFRRKFGNVSLALDPVTGPSNPNYTLTISADGS
jgi:hypothetical protein